MKSVPFNHPLLCFYRNMALTITQHKIFDQSNHSLSSLSHPHASPRHKPIILYPKPPGRLPIFRGRIIDADPGSGGNSSVR